jgi:hypothetical protein
MSADWTVADWAEPTVEHSDDRWAGGMAAVTVVLMADWTAGRLDRPSAATWAAIKAIPSVGPMVDPLVASMDGAKAALSETLTAAHSVDSMAGSTAASWARTMAVPTAATKAGSTGLTTAAPSADR